MFPRVARRPRTCAALIGAVALLAAAGAVPAWAAGPFEPNDNIGQAYGPLTGATDYGAALENRSDRDYYIFYATSQAQLDIAFTVGLVKGKGVECIVALVRDDTSQWNEERALRKRIRELEK